MDGVRTAVGLAATAGLLAGVPSILWKADSIILADAPRIDDIELVVAELSDAARNLADAQRYHDELVSENRMVELAGGTEASDMVESLRQVMEAVTQGATAVRETADMLALAFGVDVRTVRQNLSLIQQRLKRTE